VGIRRPRRLSPSLLNPEECTEWQLDLVVYVLRSPHIRQLASFGKLSEARSEHEAGAFFLYIGPFSDNEKLYVSHCDAGACELLLSLR